MNSIVSENINQLVDQWLEAENKGIKFPVPFDIAWQMAGYSNKANAKRSLPKAAQGELFIICEEKTNGRPKENISLSCDGLKHLCLMANTVEGQKIRQYFIEAEKKWRLVEKHHPEIASEIEVLRLQAEISRNQRYIMERSEFILDVHGKQVLALVQGRPDVVIHEETIVTEVVEPVTGTVTKILTADQLKKAIKDRTGQKLKSLKDFTDTLRKAGRDDLLVPVTRSQTYEYPVPDKLDEAIAVVYGKARQKLIGE
jgi:hypothetical protein